MARINDKIYINGTELRASNISIGPDGLNVDIPHYYAQDSFDRGVVNCCASSSIGGDYINAGTFPQAAVDNLTFESKSVEFYPVKKYKSGIKHLCRNELAVVFVGAGAY